MTLLTPQFQMHHRLRLAVEAANVEIEELAELADVTPSTIYRWMAGNARPRRPTLTLLADRLCVPLAWLETGEAARDEAPATVGGGTPERRAKQRKRPIC